jgi:hypothetical protein
VTVRLYGEALAPPLGCMADYLRGVTRNCEGVWVRCRLRADVLPLLHTLGRQCVPRWPDDSCRCSLCPIGSANAPGEDGDAPDAALDTREHFLARCSAEPLVQLRRGLIQRLRRAAAEWDADSEAPPRPAVGGAVPMRHSACVALSRILDAFEHVQPRAPAEDAQGAPAAGAVDADEARGAWVELLLGRETYLLPGGGEARWPPSLLQHFHKAIHDFLALAWRARARLLGGVPALRRDPSGTSICLQAYKRCRSLNAGG